jgi:hypothetical protein
MTYMIYMRLDPICVGPGTIFSFRGILNQSLILFLTNSIQNNEMISYFQKENEKGFDFIFIKI